MFSGYSFSNSCLKSIAYFTMFIDHFFGIVFIAYINAKTAQGFSMEVEKDIYSLGRAVGRISFVLFAYMMAEGFRHTRSIKKYLFRLGLFAVISEIPFDIAFYGKLFYIDKQNVYFTLFIGVAVLYFVKELQGHLLLQLSSVLLGCVAAAFLKTDYMFMGVLLIVVFYVCRRSFWYQFVAGSLTIYFGIVLVYIVRYWSRGYSIKRYLNLGLSELYGLFAFLFIYYYNGKKGRQLPKLCYYLFYPLHLLLLYMGKQWIVG